MILSDKKIKELSLNEQKMIDPFQNGTKGISSGVSSYGYDSKLEKKEDLIIDPKKFDASACKEVVSDDYFILPPFGFALGSTVEYFRIPKNVLVTCLGKSTYARCGLFVNVTPLEPEWEGNVTLEFFNATPMPIKLYVNEGICQFIFYESSHECEITYAQKKGKYNKQTGVTLPKK